MNKKSSTAAWGMLSAIVTELVLAPGILGGLGYFLGGKLIATLHWDQVAQIIITLFCALGGLGIAFYRINQISARMDKMVEKDDQQSP